MAYLTTDAPEGIPDRDAFGGVYTEIERIPVRRVLDEGLIDDALVILAVDNPRQNRCYVMWDSEDGLTSVFGCNLDRVRRDSLRAAERINGDATRYMLMRAFHAARRELGEMTDREIVARASKHRTHGVAWGKLKNPIVFRSNSTLLHYFDVTSARVRDPELREWLEERAWSLKPEFLVAQIVTYARCYRRVEVPVLDFEEPEHAFEFRMRWL